MPRSYTTLLALWIAAMLLSACSALGFGKTHTDSIFNPDPLIEEGAYPVTVDHKYGSTTLTQFPARIVLIGLTEQDALLALGVTPVTTREWYGNRPGALFPWAVELLGEAPLPIVLKGELNFEYIAALQPDVIIGLYSGTTQEEYAKLSQIAPTVAQPGEFADWGVSWQQLTLRVGQIVGQPQRAQELVDAVEAKFAQAREQHPEFAGLSGVVASPWGYPENYYAYGPQDGRGRFIADLGFSIPQEIIDLAGEEFGATISRERLDLVDLDVLIWTFDTARNVQRWRNDPIYQQLNAYQQGRDVFLWEDDPVFDAFNFASVLSLPYVIDHLLPRIQAAADGDPSTHLEVNP
ncbi:MAG: iron-siderophore ABC transporter substrate-binding protein [Enhydrobacter sp.]|nr:iron-siderophore ABC transporter substrate-binding protein [Enhydrobacter sp.]